ncbi:putative reverse transcriptase domain-containing protein [Tanacetum coccineum]
MSMTIQSSVMDKILATSSETSKVENTPAEMLRDLDQQMEKRADDGKANVVTNALSSKERVKPRRVRAMAMTIQYGVSLVGSEMDEAHASRYLVHPGADKTYYNLGDMYWWSCIRKVIAIYVSKFWTCLRGEGVRGMILTSQSEAFKQENVLAEILHGLDQHMERKGDESLM